MTKHQFVILVIHNLAMQKFDTALLLKMITLMALVSSEVAKADVYVDTSQADEISIANTSNEQNYTFKIEEPVIVTNSALASVGKKTAKENNVKELSKTMTIASKAGGYFLYGSKWNFQFLVNLKFQFQKGLVLNLCIKLKEIHVFW